MTKQSSNNGSKITTPEHIALAEGKTSMREVKKKAKHDKEKLRLWNVREEKKRKLKVLSFFSLTFSGWNECETGLHLKGPKFERKE